MNTLSSFRKLSSTKSFGIELECFGEGFSEGVLHKHHGFFYATTDGSIDTDRWAQSAVEFVSQPLPLEWLKKELVKLGKKFTWETNYSCGIHVHVNRKWCTLKKAKAIYRFLRMYYDEHYEDYQKAMGRGSNTYCRFNNMLCRYCVVNVMNSNTIEFRMFASGSVKWAQYCVELVNYLVENASHLNVDAFNAAVDMLASKYA